MSAVTEVYQPETQPNPISSTEAATMAGMAFATGIELPQSIATQLENAANQGNIISPNHDNCDTGCPIGPMYCGIHKLATENPILKARMDAIRSLTTADPDFFKRAQEEREMMIKSTAEGVLPEPITIQEPQILVETPPEEKPIYSEHNYTFSENIPVTIAEVKNAEPVQQTLEVKVIYSPPSVPYEPQPIPIKVPEVRISPPTIDIPLKPKEIPKQEVEFIQPIENMIPPAPISEPEIQKQPEPQLEQQQIHPVIIEQPVHQQPIQQKIHETPIHYAPVSPKNETVVEHKKIDLQEIKVETIPTTPKPEQPITHTDHIHEKKEELPKQQKRKIENIQSEPTVKPDRHVAVPKVLSTTEEPKPVQRELKENPDTSMLIETEVQSTELAISFPDLEVQIQNDTLKTMIHEALELQEPEQEIILETHKVFQEVREEILIDIPTSENDITPITMALKTEISEAVEKFKVVEVVDIINESPQEKEKIYEEPIEKPIAVAAEFTTVFEFNSIEEPQMETIEVHSDMTEKPPIKLPEISIFLIESTKTEVTKKIKEQIIKENTVAVIIIPQEIPKNVPLVSHKEKIRKSTPEKNTQIYEVHSLNHEQFTRLVNTLRDVSKVLKSAQLIKPRKIKFTPPKEKIMEVAPEEFKNDPSSQTDDTEVLVSWYIQQVFAFLAKVDFQFLF